MNYLTPLLISLIQLVCFLAFVFWFEKKVYLPKARVALLALLWATFYASSFVMYN